MKSKRQNAPEPRPKDVDAYIASAPAVVRPMLRELRLAIKQAAPEALEKISYGMPTYECYGKLTSFAGYATHVGLYGVVHEDRLADEEARQYLESRSTLRFPAGRPLPVALVERVVAARVNVNKASQRRKP